MPQVLVVFGLIGIIAGAALIGPWAIGCAIIADSAMLIVAGMFWPRPERTPADNRPAPVQDFLREP